MGSSGGPSLGWAEDHEIVREYADTVIALVGKVDGCNAEIITASLVLAESSKTHIDGAAGEPVDLGKQLEVLKVKRQAEAIKQAEDSRKLLEAQAEEKRKADEAQTEQERTVAEAQAKRDAVEAARRKRLAAEQKRKQAEADARYAKAKAEQDAKVAEEQRKLREACSGIYQNTIDKKVKDLTVREDQQVRSCQALGLYPPQ